MKRKELNVDQNHEQDSSKQVRAENMDLNNAKMIKTGSSNSEKQQKYDRQLRLWGDHGQQALEKANICLINATATGTEVLKCLILPGVGKFTVVDEKLLEEADLGSNFFLAKDSIGQPRAVAACSLLQELNPDVNGHSFVQNPVNLLENDPQFFRQFSLVIASRLSENSLLKFGNFLWQSNIPLVVCDNFGFLGYIRLVVKEQTVVESKPDNTIEDLRLDKPFPGLVNYVTDLDMDSMGRLEHSHTPFLVILYLFLQRWKQENNAVWPKNYKEKCQLKELIKAGIQKNDDGVPYDEENFEEAVKNVNALSETKVPSHISKIFEDRRCEHPIDSNAKDTKFWILARALKEFVNLSEHNILPLRGSLPDMFSDSKRYIELQNVYKEQANQDAETMSLYVREILQDLQLPADYISSEEIKVFCKNCHFLHVCQGLSLHDEFRPDIANHQMSDTIDNMWEMGSDIYLIIRCVNQFVDDKGRYPGEKTNEVDDDVKHLTEIAGRLKEGLHISSEISPDHFHELCRCNSKELHSVAAVVGGMTAQEIIKLLTNQFVTIDNTFLYNSITQSSLTIKL